VAQVLDRALCPVLVGRAPQLEALEDALLAADRGEGQVVILAGEAGMGKTRLAEELQSAARRAGTVVMEGSCSEAELALPYLPFLEAIGNYLAIADLDVLRERLGPFRRELAQLFPQMDPEASHGDGGDPTQGRLRLFEALLALLRIPADEHGVLLIVEDIHWADASTRELLDYMTRRLRTTRIMVLATYRSDELHRRHPLLPMVQGWRRSGTARIVELEHLTPDGIADMVRAIFDTDEVTDEFRDFLYERSEGNPFVAEELLKAALDRGDIYRTDIGWERREVRDLTMPRTVTDSVLLRLERLSDEEAEILHAASVLGRTFDYRTLAAMAGPSEERVQEGLRLFVQQQLMEEEADTHRYRFRHALTREAIYTDLISPRRLALHSRAADALSSIEGTPPVDLAFHLLAAGRHAEAIPVVLAAAQDAERRLGFGEAVALYERIVPYVSDELPRAELLGRLGRATYWSGQGPRGQPHLEEAIPVLERHSRVAEAAGYRLWLGRIYWERSRPDVARAEYEHVRDALEPLGPSEDLANAYTRLAGMHLFEYELRDAVELASRAREIATAAGAEAARIWSEVFIGSGLAAMPGRENEGYGMLLAVQREAFERGYPWIAGNALFNDLETRVFNYRPREALERLQIYREFGRIRSGGPQPDYIEGAARVFMGEPEVARPFLELSGQTAEASGFTTFASWSGRFLAVCLSMLDLHAEARAALPGPSGRNERQDAVPVSTFAMRILADGGELTEAVDEAMGAIGLLSRRPNDWIVEERRLADQVIDVLLAADRAVDAERTMAVFRAARVRVDDPYLLRSGGRMALAAGDAATAVPLLEEAATTFRGVEYRDDEWRTRRVLAEALASSDLRDAAERELRQVRLEAQEHGHVAEARRAGEALGALGAPKSPAGASPPKLAQRRGRADEVSRARGAPAAAASRAPDRQGAARQARSDPAELPQAKRAVAAEAGAARVGQPSLGRSRPTEVVATVMFLDVRGYTEQTARRAPQDTVDRLSSLHRWAKREVERHHGAVDKFAGDAVMAVFNASGARLDHAVHALQAALAIRDKAVYAGMPVGIGLATGPAVVGQLVEGSNVSAVGESTNLAARLQTAAAAGEILLSEETYRRVKDWLATRSLAAEAENLELKGFERPISAFRLG
jgi:class 3 adenylate cyclase